jgi:hypothetical protein
MPERALIGALKRTRVSACGSPDTSSPGGSSSDPKHAKRSVTFGDKQTLGTADAAIDRTPHGEPPRCGGCGLHCLGRLYACKTCERRVSLESLEVGAAFHEKVSRAFNLCTVCFSAHVRMTAKTGDALSDASKREKSEVRRDVAVILENVIAIEKEIAERGDREDAHRFEHRDALAMLREGQTNGDRSARSSAGEESDDGFSPKKNARGAQKDRNDSRVFVCVHEHGPYEFCRRNDTDQQMMEEMLEEKRRFAMVRKRDGSAEGENETDGNDWADSDDDARDSAPCVSDENHVGVGEVGVAGEAGLKPKPKPKPVWDYVSEVI